MTVGDDAGVPPVPRGVGAPAPVDELPADSSTVPVDTGPPPGSGPVDHTRISASWTALVVAVVVFVVLVVFIAQNTQASTVNFLGFHGRAPTAVMLLIAAVAGAVIVVVAGVARIIQLRRMARHS